MVRPSLPPAQLGSPKGMGRRQQQQQDINPPQYQLQHQQHEMVNGGLMNGGNYQVVGGGGGTAYNVYQNQSTHPQPYNDPHQQQLNERALGGREACRRPPRTPPCGACAARGTLIARR